MHFVETNRRQLDRTESPNQYAELVHLPSDKTSLFIIDVAHSMQCGLLCEIIKRGGDDTFILSVTFHVIHCGII